MPIKFSDVYPNEDVKIYPENIAGMVGLPSVGKIFYVDPTAGSNSDSGTSKEAAFATITQAHTSMSADNDDVAVIAGTGATGRTSEAAAVTWSKRRTHIVGNGPARKMNPRNGIAAGYSGGTTTAVFTITGNNCSFSNISFATFNDNNILVDVQADYLTFKNVHFQGIGHADTGDDANGRSLLITDSGENEFYNCTIGLDTIARGGAANSSLELTGSCPRNKFYGCEFPMYADGATVTWVKADTGNCYERYLLFKDCLFTNATLGSATEITVGMDLSTTGNGQVYCIDSPWYGATDLVNNVTNLIQANTVYDTNDQGLMTVHANS